MAKKSSTVRKIYAVVFLVLMATYGVSSAISFIDSETSASAEEENTDTTSIIFSEQYPFEENDEVNSSSNTINLSFIRNYSSFFYDIANKTDDYLTSSAPLSTQLKKCQRVLRIFSDDEIYYDGSDSFVKLSNGHLVGCFDYCPPSESWNNILDFSKWLQGKDIPYVTLITPDKSDDSITTFPECIPHGYSQTFDEYTSFLNENGLYYIDSKQLLLSENSDLYSWFYKSDHHWNVQASFVTARETAKILNEELSITTDSEVLDDSNFELTVYSNSFLGTYGNVLGDEWYEDMAVLYPTGETNFHIEIPNYGIDKTGSFDTTLIDQNQLGEESTYNAFLYGSKPLVHIENNDCDNGTKILVIKYSFANPLCPYLASTVQYLDMIDPRNFDGSIRSYIEQTKPDAVVLCMGVVTEYDEDNLHLK